MRSFHRGFRSFRRNYARNLIVVVLLFVCLTFSMSMLAVKLAADNQVQTIKQQVGNYAEIKVSSTYQMKQFEAERQKSAAERQAEARSMTPEQEHTNRVASLVPEKLTNEFSKDNQVKTYDKVLETPIALSGITNTDLQPLFALRDSRDTSSSSGQQPGARENRGIMGLNQNSFVFGGNTNGASASDFTTGAKKLIEGKQFTYDDYLKGNPVVVAEKNLAADNKLKVGDTITAQISGQSGVDSYVNLKIIGIYETVQAQQQSQSNSSSNLPQGLANFNPAGNEFYAPLSVVQKLNNTPGYVQLGSYYFGSVDNTAALKVSFKKDAVGTGGQYELATDLADYQAIADPLLKARNTSVIGLAGALGACALIILLAMIIIVSGRTRELGILKAIGSTDKQVIGQFAFEVLCICLVAIIFAMGATALIGQSLGNWLLPKTSKTTTQTQQAQGGSAGGFMQMLNGSKLYKEGGRYNTASASQGNQAARLNVVYRGALFLYGVLILVLISLIGMAIPIFWIIRLRPARVLSME
jgi:ABC-type antimicrobial peptide transport system permease subunit